MLSTEFNKLKIYSAYHIRNLAFRLGILDGHASYSKFLILGRGRTGSNLLRSLLNSHSQIVAFGELFKSPETIGWEYPGYNKSQSLQLLSLFRNDPIKFLETEVYKTFPKQIRAVGFKIFYTHAQTDSWKPVWSYFKNDKNLKIIHLKRKNVLKAHLSLQKARQTGKWRNTSGSKEEFTPLALDYQECLEAFTKTRALEEQYETFFEGHQKLELLYEDLSQDYLTQMKRLQPFLDVDPETVQPLIYKQSAHPLSQSISNYAELKEQFQGTPWEEFFEE